MTKWVENEHAEAGANLEYQRQAIARGGGSVSELDYAIGYLDAITNAWNEESGMTENDNQEYETKEITKMNKWLENEHTDAE